MRSHLVRALFVGLAFGLAATGHAQATAPAADISGAWNFCIVGNRGALVLHFAAPQFGVFDASGAGYTTLFPQQAFAVDDSPVQNLAFDSRGRIHGSIALTNVTRTASLGTLTVTTGTINALRNHVNLTGTLAIGEGPAQNVRLSGVRLAPPSAALTGRARNGGLLGTRVRSTTYDVQVYDASSAPAGGPATPGESYPFFVLRAGGAAQIDGVEVLSTRIDGLLVSDPRGTIFGRLTSSEFGPCNMRGTFTTNDPRFPGQAVLHFAIIADSGRRVRLAAALGPFTAQ